MSYFVSDKTGFQQSLNKRISAYFRDNNISKYANGIVWAKIYLLLFLWLLSLFLIYLFGDSMSKAIVLYLIHGVFCLLLVFNVGHDAAHGALSPKPAVNHLFSYSFNLLGGNSYSWKLKHNIGHHFFTNIHGKDIDIETVPLFRVSPFTMWRFYYRFQHIYILPLYCVLSLALIFVLDFKVMFVIRDKHRKNKILREWLILIFTKVFYIFYLIIIPFLIHPLTLFQVIVCFLIMHCLLGLFISLVLLPSHFVAHARFYENYSTFSECRNSWATHQLLSTIDIAPESKCLNFFLGGLNTNIVHHIYPKICHVHLIPLVKILKTTAEEYNQPYISYSLSGAMKEHFRFLKMMGKRVNTN
jgi:linoleoyl-CoA desaturase